MSVSPRLREPWRSLAAAALGLAAAALVAWWGPHPRDGSLPLPMALLDHLGAPPGSRATVLHPQAWWLLPIAALPLLVTTLRRTLVDTGPSQLAAQLVTRLLAIGAIALALSQPTLRTPIRGKTVVFVVDLSDSIDDTQLDAARELWTSAAEHTEAEDRIDVPPADRTRLALVTYAQEPRIVATRSDGSSDDPFARPERGQLASHHGDALRLAAAMVDPRTEGRIVLVTDGDGSAAEREDLALAIRELRADHLSIHVRRFEPRTRRDVLVDAVHLPSELRIGETFEVIIDITSTSEGTATLRLQQDGEANRLAPEMTVELRPGTQQVRMLSRPTRPGTTVYTAVLDPSGLDPDANRRTGNDRASAIADVRGRPRVLLLGTGGDELLAAALRADHLDVEVRTGSDAPTTSEALRAFDLVLLSDIPAGAVPAAARAQLERYVVDDGGGLVMIGGPNAFGLGGWEHTDVASLLPVRFDGERQREQPKLALVLVIDKSGSMSSEDKLDLVKEAARSTARALEPNDELGVIAFDSRPHILVRLQPASNRIRIAADIRRLTSGGGTNALPALREAYLQLAGSNALVKHVILLSDGQSPENGISALLGDMQDADITVSTVGVGAGAGKDLLRRVANRGRGRFYYSHDGTDVPRIFSRETREVTRNAVRERPFYPRVTKNAQVLRGIDFGTAPGLRGLVPVRPKPLAEVLLQTNTGQPLFVRGRRGLGRTAAFSSDAKARWAAAWAGWSGFAKLWSQIARDTMRQGATLLGGADISIHETATPGTHRVVVDVDASRGFVNDLHGRISVTDPESSTAPEIRTLELTAPGRYETTLQGVSSGQRLVVAELFDASSDPPRRAAEATARVSIPYPAELRPASQVDSTTWSHLSADSDEGPIDDVLERPGDPMGRQRNEALWPYALWALLLPILLLDLLLRRVSLGRRRIPV